MDIAETKIEAQRILQHERSKTFFVWFTAVLIKFVLFGAAAFGIYSVISVKNYEQAKSNPILLYSLYALFFLEVLISLFAVSAVDYNKKRWFYINSFEKTPFSFFFFGEKLSTRLKVFYLYLFKAVMSFFCVIFCEIPFILCFGAAFYYLRANNMYRSVFAAVIVLLSVLFFLGLYFGSAVGKRYYYCEKIFFKDKKCSVISSIKQSKSLTAGYRFRLVNYDLSFIFWVMLCIFIFPIFYSAPYINQSKGTIAAMFLGTSKEKLKKTAPVLFMKPLKP